MRTWYEPQKLLVNREAGVSFCVKPKDRVFWCSGECTLVRVGTVAEVAEDGKSLFVIDDVHKLVGQFTKVQMENVFTSLEQFWASLDERPEVGPVRDYDHLITHKGIQTAYRFLKTCTVGSPSWVQEYTCMGREERDGTPVAVLHAEGKLYYAPFNSLYSTYLRWMRARAEMDRQSKRGSEG